MPTQPSLPGQNSATSHLQPMPLPAPPTGPSGTPPSPPSAPPTGATPREVPIWETEPQNGTSGPSGWAPPHLSPPPQFWAPPHQSVPPSPWAPPHQAHSVSAQDFTSEESPTNDEEHFQPNQLGDIPMASNGSTIVVPEANGYSDHQTDLSYQDVIDPDLSQLTPPYPGWWIASDGYWYPPEVHPANLVQ